ncbi:MAG: TIGR03857 family LLM class F420-dependent oxidoreductase [Rhodocyclaceae bacterium]|nr:TIGR03857 family LLM class F420-dependent oxidoreductase [Rhodocyclaceae bacterium]
MAVLADVLNSYILPGHAADARPGLKQAQDGERLGLGGIFLSERWETKELGAVMGALTQVTRRVKLVAGLTHFGTRHPLVLAGMAATMQALSNGRFVLGFGRGVPSQFAKLGIPVLNNQGMADYVGILRKLWAGETINYKGPAGDYPAMQLAHSCDNPPPIIMGATGPKTLAMAGAHFDGVVLHPFLTIAGVKRSVDIVRNAAKEAGRDPKSIRIYAIVVTAPDTLAPAVRADVLEARAVSYFMHKELGQPIINMNGWDEAPMNQLVAADLAKLDYGTADLKESRRLMAEAALKIIPQEWLTSGAAIGSVDHCISRLREYIAAGADEILLHGTTPDQQEQVIAAACTQVL